MRSGVKPSSADRRFHSVRTKRPAPISSTTDRPTCSTTSDRRARRRDRLIVARPPSLRAVATRTCVACHIGARLNNTPVSIVTPIDKPKHPAVEFCFQRPGSHDVESKRGMPLRSQKPSSTPAAPPSEAMTRPSVSICRPMRQCPAPSASRKLISRWRAAARASSRLARFAQAMSSTRPTNATSTNSGWLNWSRRSSTPRLPSVSRSRGRAEPGDAVSSGLTALPSARSSAACACRSSAPGGGGPWPTPTSSQDRRAGTGSCHIATAG